MIYPEISLERWCEQNPLLEVRKDKCDYCGGEFLANIPFIDKNWVGLTSKKCFCGNTFSIQVPRQEKILLMINEFFDNKRNEYE